MSYQEFRELKVWQEAKQLVVQIYKITSNEKFSLNQQLLIMIFISGTAMVHENSEAESWQIG